MSYTLEALAYVVPIWARNTATAYISLATLIGIPGNLLVFAVQVKNKRKTPTDWFVLFMAISDILSLVICAPPFIMACTGVWPTIGSSFWCKLHLFMLHMTNILTALLIVCVGIDRYNHIVRNHPTKHFTSANIMYTYTGAILLSSIICAGPIFIGGNNTLGQCMILPSRVFEQKIIHGFIAFLVASISVVLTVMYAKIIRSITLSMKVRTGSTNRLSLMTSTNRSRILKTTKIMAIVTFVFILSTCATAIAAVFLHSQLLKDCIHVKTAMFFLTKGSFINNCTNPIFYIWLYPSFREKALRLFIKTESQSI